MSCYDPCCCNPCMMCSPCTCGHETCGCNCNRGFFGLDEDTLSKHILLLGGSGCGKTNVYLYFIDMLKSRLNENDVAIIFDTKGEFYREFAEPGDIVIGNGKEFYDKSHTWNIFDEILADGREERNISMNAKEMAAALFHDRGSSSQPFFCNAAKDIFYCMLMHFLRSAERDPGKWQPRLNNKSLVRAFGQFTVNDYLTLFSMYPDFRYMQSYIGTGNSNQGLGVMGELNSMLAEYFIGILAEYRPDRNLSMRRFVRNKGAKMLFVEYDLSIGETLAPIYRLLIDQTLKEALSRSEAKGRVYLIADEFKLLPKLQHIDDALNFGRSMGVRVIAGIQSIDQLYDIYGEDKANVIASGFGTMFAFHTNDSSSRNYIKERFGTNYVSEAYTIKSTGNYVSSEREGHTVEEWDQMNLGLGQAVIGLGYDEPFIFQFGRYKEKRNG